MSLQSLIQMQNKLVRGSYKICMRDTGGRRQEASDLKKYIIKIRETMSITEPIRPNPSNILIFCTPCFNGPYYLILSSSNNLISVAPTCVHSSSTIYIIAHPCGIWKIQQNMRSNAFLRTFRILVSKKQVRKKEKKRPSNHKNRTKNKQQRKV